MRSDVASGKLLGCFYCQLVGRVHFFIYIFLQVSHQKLKWLLKVQMERDEGFKLVKKVAIPIRLEFPNQWETKVILNMTESYGKKILPVKIKVAKEELHIHMKKAQSESLETENRTKVVQEYRLNIKSEHTDDVEYTANIPQNQKKPESRDIIPRYFSLYSERGQGKLTIFNQYSQAHRELKDCRQAPLSFQQMLKIQQSMIDNRKKRNLTQQQVLEMDSQTDF